MVFELKTTTIEHVAVESDMYGEQIFYEIKNVLMLISHVEINIDIELKMVDDDIVNVVHHIHGQQIC